jgi:hypothetical protein
MIWSGSEWVPSGELREARGDRSNLNARITTISNFASPNAAPNIVGQFYDNAFHATASTTRPMVTNQLDLVPYYTSQRLRIDQIGIAVSTASAGSLAAIVIYTSTPEGWPDEVVFEGSSVFNPLDCGTTGYKTHTGVDFTFDAGRIYWLGVKSSGTATLRAVNVGSSCNLGVNGSGGTNYLTILRRALTWPNDAPDPYGVATGHRVANLAPFSVRFRCAAL